VPDHKIARWGQAGCGVVEGVAVTVAGAVFAATVVKTIRIAKKLFGEIPVRGNSAQGEGLVFSQLVHEIKLKEPRDSKVRSSD